MSCPASRRTARSVAPRRSFRPALEVLEDRTTPATLVSAADLSLLDRSAGGSAAEVSADGRYVLFQSDSAVLAPADANNAPDLFVRDLQLGTTTLVSARVGGGTGSGESRMGHISANGRYVLFESTANNLVGNDFNTGADLFVRDLQTGTTILVTENLAGQADGSAYFTQSGISADGRYVVFDNLADDLVAGDGNGVGDVFIRDLQTQTTKLVSRTAGGLPGNEHSEGGVLSADGNHVAFISRASDLTPGAVNGAFNVYVHDLRTGLTQLASVNRDGTGGGGQNSVSPRLSADGRRVVFVSYASDLAPGDANSAADVFVRDLQTGTTILVSHNSAGTGTGNRNSDTTRITPDGRFVAFLSLADDLVVGDTNPASDVFVCDTQTGALVRVTSGTAGTSAVSGRIGLSPDGRFVTFERRPTDPLTGFGTGIVNVYAHDVQTAATWLVSARREGTGGGNGDSSHPVMSADGGRVVFQSTASNLAAEDRDNVADVYAHDLLGHTTVLASFQAGGAGATANGASLGFHRDAARPTMSADGRFVVFVSEASNLAAGDHNGVQDVFLRDRQLGTTVLVSRRSGGGSGNGRSSVPTVSADGRFVLFQSEASDLAPNDLNGAVTDLFVFDAQTASLTLVSENRFGTGSGNGASERGVISANGRLVAFTTDATDLTANDTNRGGDVFVRDLQTRTTTLVSRNLAGTGTANNTSSASAISADGRYVALISHASDLSLFDGPGKDIFVWDRQTGGLTLVTQPSVGPPSPGADWLLSEPVMTPDGRFVAFSSAAGDLVAQDTNNKPDVFVRDMLTGAITLVSRNAANGGSGNRDSILPAISADGRYVAFTSDASDLVAAGDTNNAGDVFVRDLHTGLSTLVSRSLYGMSGANGVRYIPTSSFASISDDGRLIVFESAANDLVAGDANATLDVFVHDRSTGITTLGSRNSAGSGSGNDASYGPQLSADGGTLLFASQANNLVAGDFNNVTDVFASSLAPSPNPTPPPVPNGLTATASQSAITLAWNPSPGAITYSLYRGIAGSGLPATLYRTGLVASPFTDSDVVGGTTYVYQVSAVNTAGESARSAEVSATPPAQNPPLFSDDFSGTAIRPGWTFRNGTWTQTDGVLRQTSTAAADPRKALLTDQTYPAAVSIAARVRVDAWTNGDLARAGIGLYTDPTTGKGYNLVFHQIAGNRNKVQFLNDGVAWGNAYDFNWQPGVWYWFKLQAENDVLSGKVWQEGTPEPSAWLYTQTGWTSRKGGAPSLNGGSGGTTAAHGNATVSFDDVTVRSLALLTLPAAPTGVFAIAGNGQVVLTWTAVPSATSYTIYRGTSAGGQGTTPWRTGLATTTFTDTSLSNGTTYYYRISAVNGVGEGGRSLEVSATPVAPASSLFSDQFTGGTVNPAWKFINGSWSQSPGVLSQTSTSLTDPRKAVLVDQSYPAAVEITAKVRVDSWTDGDAARAGVGLYTDPVTGKGYNLVFHHTAGTKNKVQFLNDGVAWGNAYNFNWDLNTWYYFKLKIVNGVLYGKVWQEGAAEPTAWMFQQSRWTSRTGGAPALNGGSTIAGKGGATVSFADVTVRSAV